MTTHSASPPSHANISSIPLGKITNTGKKVFPWLAGAAMGLGHIAVSTHCTIPQQGRCAACGSCILVVGSLVSWAIWKQRQGGDFYIEK